MTEDDIVVMAVNAGASALFFKDNIKFIQRFAKLVAEHECRAIAQMIEDAPALTQFAQNDKGGCLLCGFTPKLAAETIRARNET